MRLSLILGLFLSQTAAYKLYQRQGLFDNESEDIDADDQDINDGPLEHEGDLVTYTQEFLTNGKNVRALN